jgi:hypothetical protein
MRDIFTTTLLLLSNTLFACTDEQNHVSRKRNFVKVPPKMPRPWLYPVVVWVFLMEDKIASPLKRLDNDRAAS